MNTVYLSRRNLLALLSKLDRQAAGEVTACTLIKRDDAHSVYPCKGVPIAVIAVEDEAYYIDRPAGELHEKDEPMKRC